jgi:hypothetical protein
VEDLTQQKNVLPREDAARIVPMNARFEGERAGARIQAGLRGQKTIFIGFYRSRACWHDLCKVVRDSEQNSQPVPLALLIACVQVPRRAKGNLCRPDLYYSPDCW